MRTLTVPATDGFQLAAQVSGRWSGPTLLLLSGQANSHRWWTSIRADFKDDFRVVTLDQRGTGESRGKITNWSTDLFADEAACVLAAIGAPRAMVYGTSMGGRVAQVLSASHPDVVGHLILACTSPGGPHARERDAGVRRSLGDPSMTAEEQRAHLRVSARHDAWDRLPSIKAPALVLHGTDDLMSPVGNAQLLADRIPSAQLHLVVGGRHGFFEEYRSTVIPLIRAFRA